MTDQVGTPHFGPDLSLISSADAKRVTARMLGLAPSIRWARNADRHQGAADQTELAHSAAALRAALWARSWSAHDVRPVYVTRLLHDALPLVRRATVIVADRFQPPAVEAMTIRDRWAR